MINKYRIKAPAYAILLVIMILALFFLGKSATSPVVYFLVSAIAVVALRLYFMWKEVLLCSMENVHDIADDLKDIKNLLTDIKEKLDGGSTILRQ